MPSHFEAVFRKLCEMSDLHPDTQSEQAVLDETKVQPPARVILFNDEVHTFDEVISQIMKATGCGQPQAEALTWEVHHTGKAMVFEGPMPECLKVSGVLEEIALHTQIEV
jgi:ATP-dependent Clp protease adapter protein ClpS